MIADFSNATLGEPTPGPRTEQQAPVWETPEAIPVPPLYTAADLDGLDFLET